MDCLVAYQLLYKSHGKMPSLAEIGALFEVAGATLDSAKAASLLSKTEGKTPEELVQAGLSKMQTVAVSASVQAPAAVEAKQEAKEEEEEEESDSGVGLFD